MFCWPTAGDMDLEPVEPVGDGVGLMPCEFGVPGAGPFELSLLFAPVKSCNTKYNIINTLLYCLKQITRNYAFY